MSTLKLDLKVPASAASFLRRAAVPTLILAVALLGYVYSDYSRLPGKLGDIPVIGRLKPQAVDWCSGEEVRPHCWYQHDVYLADAILKGDLDVTATDIPDYYQDVVPKGPKRYLPFPVGPALLLLPFVAVWGTDFSEVYVSIVLGAVNVVLFWYLLSVLNISRTSKWLLVPFFAFGTPHFYSATTGTVWFYNHVAAMTFVLLALILLFKRVWPVIPAALLGFGFLAREPVVLAAPFLLYWLVAQRHASVLTKEALLDKRTIYDFGLISAGLLPFVIFWFAYNFVRFDNPLETGYETVYRGYGGIPYSFYLRDFPNAARFGLFDVRNIPLHLYTMFLMPPQFVPDWSVLRPSPYGMSVVLTSPAFVYAFFVKGRNALRTGLWLTIGLISIPLLFHWTQGWVQFGYRFMLDFAPFLLILTAWGFDDNRTSGAMRVQVFLVVVSIGAGFWGRYWANQLAW